MGRFIASMVASLGSGNLEQVSIGFFDLTFLLFVVAATGYTAFLMKGSDRVWRVGFIALVAGIGAMTLALGLRWAAAGLYHPPWSNLYESLVFFSWGLVVCYAIMEVKYKVKFAGAFIAPLVMIALGLATFATDKNIQPLMPALQSIWLHFHVFGASIAYAMFIVGFGFAVLYLFRDGLPMPNFHTTAATFNVLAIAAVTKGRVLVAGFPLYQSTDLGGRFVRTPIPDTEPVRFLTMELPGLGAMTLVALVAFALATVLGVSASRSDDAAKRRRAFWSLAFATILLTFALGHMIARSGSAPNYNLSANGYGFALLAAGWIFALLTITLELAGDRLRERLPATKVLDNLTYKSIVVAFPILTFMLLSGAIWANQAWGRFWGWDPKETAALVTWFVYLIYLHTRITRGWKGRKTAYIAVLGFASVLFTYLGVNLVISGLHSYATG